MSAVRERRVSVLGSTGSVGVNTLDLIQLHNSKSPGTYFVVALTANSNVEALAKQARMLRPEFVAIGQVSRYAELKAALSGTGVEIGAGPDALEEAALRDADWLMASIIGSAGLRPTLAAVSRGKTVALANKECLVSAGALFMSRVKQAGTTLLPVDSEHNAVFQVFDPAQAQAIQSITLTASGGPFRTWTAEQMETVTPAQACKHPNYSMGAKISVDSATLMNKGLELIEAHHLFGTPPERLCVIVHPQQAVHCLVSYVDGSVLAQLGSPDMRTPIAYALGYPQRISAPVKPLNLADLGQLTFEAPDTSRFPCLALAQAAMQKAGSAPTVLNAANEVSVAAFLAGKITFPAIARIVENTMNFCNVPAKAPDSIEDALSVDGMAREHAKRALQN